MTFASRLLASATLIALAACADLSHVRDDERIEFELSGRIAIRLRDEASSGNIAWRHRIEGDELLITSSLGQGIARLRREGGRYLLTTSDAREYRAADAESLTEEVLGYPLPIAGLADWVRARPHREGPVPTLKYDVLGRLAELRQGDWHIRYLAYRDETPASPPSRMSLAYPGLEIRLAIGSWKHSP